MGRQCRIELIAVADAEVRRLKETLEQELQQRQVRASRYHAPMSNVRGIFEEGHRLVQAKMKLKVGVIDDDEGIPLNAAGKRQQQLKNAGFFC